MKRIKLMAAAAIMAAVAIAGYMGYTAYEYATMTPQERLMLANIEALTRSEPGDSAGNDCPNGGYYSTGKRTEDTKNMWAKIDSNSGIAVSFSSTPISASAGYTVEWVQTVAYNCDQSTTAICLVCNRYKL